MSYRRIIVGTDGSETARIAERTAALLARAADAHLLVASAYKGAPEQAETILQRSLENAREVWPRVSARKERGNASDVLVSLARDEQADLLVVGNKGMTGRAHFLLGSVPDSVSHQAPCDLLIVKTSSVNGSLQGQGLYQKVLIATDGSPTSLEAVKRGFRIAARLGATPVLFYAGHPRTAEVVFAEVVREFLPAGMLQTASAEGDPGDAICEVAQKEGYDLVVLGNKGMVGGRWHIGLVPNKVSHQAPTDLLIVKTVGATSADLAHGEGAVIKVEGESVAVYKDESGAVLMLSPRCTHMGCTVGWNSFDRTWDCPCHGSRYDARGEVIRGPATRELARVDDKS
ncbi:MAG: universal stress protein [Chloroflexota bacterium]|nr:universal stress protein [Chloroflexota bacterium]